MHRYVQARGQVARQVRGRAWTRESGGCARPRGEGPREDEVGVTTVYEDAGRDECLCFGQVRVFCLGIGEEDEKSAPWLGTGQLTLDTLILFFPPRNSKAVFEPLIHVLFFSILHTSGLYLHQTRLFNGW